MKNGVLFAVVMAVALTGCTARLTGGVDALNQRIAYLGLNDKNCWNPDNQESARSCQLDVGAGMRIRLDSIALPSGNEKVEQQTLPSSYTYTVPDVDGAMADGLALGRENAFFMTTLLSMSEQDRDDLGAWQLMYGNDSESYSSRVKTAPGTYATSILKPFLEKIRVDYQFVEKSGIPRRTTSQLAKRVFCSADARDHTIGNGLASRTLHVTLPPEKDGTRTIAIGSDDWFYADQVGVINATRGSEFMRYTLSTPSRARNNIELSIAVRLSSEEGVRYVPPCTTVADIERMFGIEIVGLWREQSNFALKGKEGDATADGLITLRGSDKSTVSPDGYYSIELRSGATAAPGGKLVDATNLCAEMNSCPESVLLAHRDVLLVGHRKQILGSFWAQ
ncbi:MULTISPECIES: hypothetical protein [Pseudomonas]|uniref:Lipoprotein n=2 Tax=Pseudomonas TaxID=286 RepID=A0A0W0I1Q0_PSEFL|nr:MULTISPECIES: hypothetical protein [Pseudomonas]KTB67081.1 hypothetical protein AO063_21525 [Pseudomonas fluorescens ICMP 11288]RMQ84167.1 hypothetical protein ALP97_02425 [Pseudomonas salomonii]